MDEILTRKAMTEGLQYWIDKIEREKPMKDLLEYTERQIAYCRKMSEPKHHRLDTYSEGGRMTEEQMSGYYQGRAEACCMMKMFIETKRTNKQNGRKRGFATGVCFVLELPCLSQFRI